MAPAEANGIAAGESAQDAANRSLDAVLNPTSHTSPNKVNDLSSMVKKKKKPVESTDEKPDVTAVEVPSGKDAVETTTNGKRKAEDDADADGAVTPVEKKAKLEDEPVANGAVQA